MHKWSVFLLGVSALNYFIPAYSLKISARLGQTYQSPSGKIVKLLIKYQSLLEHNNNSH